MPLISIRPFGAFRLLRALVRETRAQTLALQDLARAVRQVAGAEGATGFVTGPADKRQDSEVLQTSNRDLAELLEIEATLTREQGGRAPDADQIVEEWQARYGRS